MSDIREKLADEMFCAACGGIIKRAAEICPKCGVRNRAAVVPPAPTDPNASDRDWLTTLLLCIFLSTFGAHRFYVGKMGTGVLMILFDWLTLFIWNLVDLILIVTGKFKDSDGKFIVRK